MVRTFAGGRRNHRNLVWQIVDRHEWCAVLYAKAEITIGKSPVTGRAAFHCQLHSPMKLARATYHSQTPNQGYQRRKYEVERANDNSSDGHSLAAPFFGILLVLY